MPEMSGGQAVVRSLVREGVDVIFGLPGVQMYGIIDALREEPGIRMITARHEGTDDYHLVFPECIYAYRNCSPALEVAAIPAMKPASRVPRLSGLGACAQMFRHFRPYIPGRGLR